MGGQVIMKGKFMNNLITPEGFWVTSATKYSGVDQVKFVEDSL